MIPNHIHRVIGLLSTPDSIGKVLSFDVYLKKLITEIIHTLQEAVDDDLRIIFMHPGVPCLPGDTLFPVGSIANVIGNSPMKTDLYIVNGTYYQNVDAQVSTTSMAAALSAGVTFASHQQL